MEELIILRDELYKAACMSESSMAMMLKIYPATILSRETQISFFIYYRGKLCMIFRFIVVSFHDAYEIDSISSILHKIKQHIYTHCPFIPPPSVSAFLINIGSPRIRRIITTVPVDNDPVAFDKDFNLEDWNCNNRASWFSLKRLLDYIRPRPETRN